MSPLDALKKYFPTGTAEGELQILDKVFVSPDQLSEVVGSSPGSPRVIIGRKGVGKTAILEWLIKVYTGKGVPCLLIRPDDIDTSELGGKNDMAFLKNKLYHNLLQAIAGKVGANLSGLLLGDSAALYEQACNMNARDIGWMGKVLNVLSTMAKPVIKIDGKELAKELQRGKNDARIMAAVANELAQQKCLFYLFIDDTDQVASPDDHNQLNRIWALLLAIRKLSQECNSIKCVVSLRTEVWLKITHNQKGQRDQIDHFRPLATFLRSPDDHMIAIVEKRLEYAAKELGINESFAKETFFERDDVSLPTSKERRNWNAFLLKSARERPRDVIQLVGHLINRAKIRGALRIDDVDAESAMKPYSKERAEDLSVEFGDICSNLLVIIRSFADRDFESNFENLRKFLLNVPSKLGLRIYSQTMSPGNEDHMLTLLRLLHEADFLNPKVRDTHMPKQYKHVSFLDDPHFVQKDRWNELQDALWEIHPVFRSYLMGIGQAKRK